MNNRDTRFNLMSRIFDLNDYVADDVFAFLVLNIIPVEGINFLLGPNVAVKRKLLAKFKVFKAEQLT